MGWSDREVLSNTLQHRESSSFNLIQLFFSISEGKTTACPGHAAGLCCISHCKDAPVFLLQCHEAPLSPRQFSLFHALSAVISCRSSSLIYPPGCLPVSFDAAWRLTCAKVINLPCPWLCWREERESRGEQGTQGMFSPTKSTFFILRSDRFFS